MEFPNSLIGASVREGEEYFFSVDCPIGVREHIHICIKRNNKILLFSTCSSKTDTAFRLAKLRGIDINTFPIFTKNNTNKFTKDQTYINCNHVTEIDETEFGKLIQEKKIHRLDGVIDEQGLQLIAKGVKLSPDVERKIKDLF